VDCVKPRFAYYTRICRPEVAAPAAREFDKVVLRTVRRILGWSEDEMARAGGQLSKRPQDGGVAMEPEERRCCFAYLGSWLDSAGALAPDMNVFQEAVGGARVGPTLRHVYRGCVKANPTRLPNTLGAFLDGVDPETLEAKFLRRGDKSVRWQALLMRGKDAEDTRRWLLSADRATKARVAEMGGAWVFAADVQGCVLTSTLWLVAMRLRFGLSVVPAIPEEVRRTERCQMRNKGGEQCNEGLDAAGHHACACQKASQQLARHRAIVRALGKELTRRGMLVAEEQWVDELAVRSFEGTPDGLRVVVLKEARLDLVVRDGTRLWWLDFTCFHPFDGGAKRGQRRSKWRLVDQEGVKHATYRVRTEDGRRGVANGRVVPIVCNSYGALGPEARSFFRLVASVARRLGRDSADSRLEPVVQSLVIFFVASGVLDAYSARP